MGVSKNPSELRQLAGIQSWLPEKNTNQSNLKNIINLKKSNTFMTNKLMQGLMRGQSINIY